MSRSIRAITAAIAILVLLGASALPVGAASATLRGTITMNGCAIAPSALVVRAQWPGAGGRGRIDVAPVESRDRTAVLRATADPRVITFSITDLVKGRLYHLAIQHHAAARGGDGPCGRVFWRGPHQGLVVAGGGSVAITGYAARTQLEVRRPGRTTAWYGADHLDLSDPEGGLRSFRWRTGITSVVAGELQVALAPFPIVVNGDACGEPRSGVVARVPLEAVRGGGWAEIGPIDLAALLAPSRAGRVTARHVPAGTTTTGLTRTQKRAILAGAPLWLRVVPRKVDGPACSARTFGVPGWVILADVHGSGGEAIDASEDPTVRLGSGHTYDAPYFDPKKHPSGDESAWLVVKPHTLPSSSAAVSLKGMLTDPLGSTLVRLKIWPGGTTLQPGAWFWIDPGEGSWWDDLTDQVSDLVTGAIDAIGFLVDEVSEAYARIKAVAAKVALEVLKNAPLVGQACAAAPAVCKKAVEAGIDAALSSVGMPPSLPNWDQLKGKALDYMAAELESQTGIPQGLSKVAYRQLASQTMARVGAARGTPGSQYAWVEPYYGYDPAVESLVLTATGALPGNLLLQREGSDLYLGDILPIPTRLSGTVRVPMVIHADVRGVPAPACSAFFGTPMPCGEAYSARWYRNHVRADVAATTCVRLTAFTRIWTWPPAILPPGADLAVSSFPLVRPRVDAGWNGVWFSDC